MNNITLRLDSLRFLLSKCQVKFIKCEQDDKVASQQVVKVKTEIDFVVKKEIDFVIPEFQESDSINKYSKDGFVGEIKHDDPDLLLDVKPDLKPDLKCSENIESLKENEKDSCSDDENVLKLKKCHVKLFRCDDGGDRKDEVLPSLRLPVPDATTGCSTDEKIKLKSCQIKLTRCDDAKNVNASTESFKKDDKTMNFKKIGNIFRCDECGKTFVSKVICQQHLLRVHTPMEERPFPCELCSKRAYATQSELFRHMILHTGELPYACTTCGERFIRQSSLNQHTFIIHKNKYPFKCTSCKKGFKQKVHLKKHMRIHSNDKDRRFKCLICLNRFKVKRDLRRHMEKVHGKLVKSVSFA